MDFRANYFSIGNVIPRIIFKERKSTRVKETHSMGGSKRKGRPTCRAQDKIEWYYATNSHVKMSTLYKKRIKFSRGKSESC